jgi:hypothetical protein
MANLFDFEDTKELSLFDFEETSTPSLSLSDFEETKEERETGLVDRLWKQTYNAAVASPTQAVRTKSSIGKATTQLNTLSALSADVQDRFGRGEPLTQKEVDWYSKLPGWGQVLKRDYEAGVAPLREDYTAEESLERLNAASIVGKKKTVQDANISAAVSEAENWMESGVDITAGVVGFVAQLAALKKAMPTAHPAVVWETQSQLSGNAPGKGALNYVALAGPSKIIKGVGKGAAVARTAAESASFASLSAVDQLITTGEIDAKQVGIAAAIPVGMKAIPALKALKKKKPTLETEIAIRSLERLVGGKTLGATRRGVPIRANVVTKKSVIAPKDLYRFRPSTQQEIIDKYNQLIPDKLPSGKQHPKINLVKSLGGLEGRTNVATGKIEIAQFKKHPELFERAVAHETAHEIFPHIYNKYASAVEISNIKGKRTVSIDKSAKPQLITAAQMIESFHKNPASNYLKEVKKNVTNWYDSDFGHEAVAEAWSIKQIGGRLEAAARKVNPKGMKLADKLFTGEPTAPTSKKTSGNIVFRAGGLKGEILHFGTKDAAKKAAGKRTVKPYQVDVKNPAKLIDSGKAHDKSVAALVDDLVAAKNPGIDPQLAPVIKKIAKEQGQAQAEKALKTALKNQGYDGIKYTNVNEAAGSPSLIPLDKSQIKPIPTTYQGLAPVMDKKAFEAINTELLNWANKAKIMRRTDVQKALGKHRQAQAGGGLRSLQWHLSRGSDVFTAIEKSKRGYKKTAIVPEITPPKLSDAQWESYARRILDLYPSHTGRFQFQRTNTLDAFIKIKNGKIPTNYEFQLLEPVMGKETTEALWKKLAAKRKFSSWEIPALSIQAGKSIFSLDIQTPRQARSVALRHPKIYAQATWDNIKGYISPKSAAKAHNKLVTSKGYQDSTKYLNYVSAGGYKTNARLEQYSLGLTERMVNVQFKNKVLDIAGGTGIRSYGKLMAASERGAASGINRAMKGMWDHAMKQLNAMPNLTEAQREAWKINRGKTINTFLKVIRAKDPHARRLQGAANYVLFSPSVTVARPLSIKAMVANEGSRSYATQLILSNIGSIAAVASIGAIIGNHERTENPAKAPRFDGGLNPLASDFGKLRSKDTIFDFTGGDAQFYRILTRVGVSAYLWGQEKVSGKEQTKILGQKVKPAGETILDYFKTRETATLGYAKALLSGKDWLGKDIDGLAASVKAFTPEVFQAAIQAGLADGTWAALAAGVGTTLSAGVDTYPVPATAIRREFKDTIAKKKHDKTWDNLTPQQAIRLRVENRKEFEDLDRQVKEEHVDTPFIPEEDISQSRLKILKGLSKENRAKVKGISVGVTRMTKNFKLNDERYQMYQESVSKYLNDRLNKTKLEEDMNPRLRIARIESAVKFAKAKALMDVRRSMK